MAKRDAMERLFRRAWAAWPSYLEDSHDAAWQAWQSLAPGEREAAADAIECYVQACQDGVARRCAFGVYLREKRWACLEPRAQEVQHSAVLAKPFGKLWQAARMKKLLAGAAGPAPVLTLAERQMVEAGFFTAEQLLADKRVKTGFPVINAMHEKATRRQGVTVSTALQPLAEMMEAVRVGSERWEEWRLEHEVRGWPWVPDPGRQEWVYFPAGGPGGLREFETAIKAGEAKGNDDGAQQAAE